METASGQPGQWTMTAMVSPDTDEGDGATDTDGDGIPDSLDTDSDGDGIPDATEGHDADGDGVADTTPSGTDTDGDGIDDAFDPDNGGTPAPMPDVDGDGIPDFQDDDSDNDGVPDSVSLATAIRTVTASRITWMTMMTAMAF